MIRNTYALLLGWCLGTVSLLLLIEVFPSPVAAADQLGATTDENTALNAGDLKQFKIDRSTHSIVFNANEWRYDEESNEYMICPGEYRSYGVRGTRCREGVGRFPTFTGRMVTATPVPLQVALERKNHSAVDVTFIDPPSIWNRDSAPVLKVFYSLNTDAEPIEYIAPNPTQTDRQSAERETKKKSSEAFIKYVYTAFVSFGVFLIFGIYRSVESIREYPQSIREEVPELMPVDSPTPTVSSPDTKEGTIIKNKRKIVLKD